MKKGILFLLAALALATQSEAQSLKDLLYSGKLKKDSSGVIRKTDDLQSKIDTAQKKQADPEKARPVTTPGTVQAEPVTGSNAAPPAEGSSSVEAAGPAPAAKSNTRIWKEYSDALIATLKAEVLSSKKVKKETYFFTVNYEVDIDGSVSITQVTASPENAYLLDQVKQRLVNTPPQLQPVMENNEARKVKRRYNFTVTKD